MKINKIAKNNKLEKAEPVLDEFRLISLTSCECQAVGLL